MNHLELTKEYRKFTKTLETKCSVRKLTICGSKVVKVETKSLDVNFTKDEQILLMEKAIEMGFAFVQGIKIEPEICSLTHGQGFEFRLTKV